MKIEEVKHSLQLDENIELHKKGWVIQRVLWVFISLFLIASIVGVFGNGFLSKEKLKDGKYFIEFEKFNRYSYPIELKLTTSATGSIQKLLIPNSYLQNFEIENIIPHPKEEKLSSGGTVYLFDSHSHTMIRFFLKPLTVGKVDGTIQVNDKYFKISHFIYP